MVKVKQKPETIKKDVSGKVRKTQMKNAGRSTSKKKAKDIVKTLKSVAKNKIGSNFKEERVNVNKPSPVKVVKKSVPKIKTAVSAKSLEKKKKNLGTISKKRVKTAKNEKPDADTKKIPKEQKQTTNDTSSIINSDDFEEEMFLKIVCYDNIKKICKALKAHVEKEVSGMKTSIFSDYKYYLNVSCYKIPNCPKRMVKLNLKHSLVDTKRDDVVLIVPDLQRGAKVDYEPTVQHYKDILLKEMGEDNIKIVPFNQLRQECSSFEAKRKFTSSYDYFLCDGRIVQHVVGFCGKTIQKPRTTIHAVYLSSPKQYKKEIEHALKRTSYRQILKGDMISIPVGNHLFNTDQLADNIELVIQQLKTLYPGGYANIRNMHIKIDITGTSSLLLYMSLAGPPVEVPNVIGPREQKMIKLKKQANDILSKFNISKTGDFVKLKKSEVIRKQQIRKGRTALLSKEKDLNKTPLSKKKEKEKNFE